MTPQPVVSCLTSNSKCQLQNHMLSLQGTASNQLTFWWLANCLTKLQHTDIDWVVAPCYHMGRKDSAQKNTMGHWRLWYIICCQVPRGPAWRRTPSMKDQWVHWLVCKGLVLRRNPERPSLVAKWAYEWETWPRIPCGSLGKTDECSVTFFCSLVELMNSVTLYCA